MSEPAGQAERSTVYCGAAADARVAELGIQASHLRNAVARGDEKRKQCGPLHPRTYPGQVMWAESTEALRQQLIPAQGGWTPGSLDNYETVYSAQLGIGIVVAGGDAFTGIAGFNNPWFNRPKGPITFMRLVRNRVSSLQPMITGLDAHMSVEDRVHTWFLLCNAREHRLFLELSFLTHPKSGASPSVWPERILLEPIDSPNGVTPIIVDPSDGGDDNDGPAVVVQRRQ